ncbi:MAG: DUF4175 family protein [Candidatus Zixiibacteriota bacterium]
MNNSYHSNSYAALAARLRLLGRSYTRSKVIQGILIFISLGLGLGLVGLLANSIFVFPVAARVAYLGAAALLLMSFFSYFCLRPIVHQPSLNDLALKVEVRFPELKNRLIAALQLVKNLKENPEGYSTDMIMAVIEQADSICGRLNLKEIINTDPLKEMGRIASLLAAFSLVFALIFPGAFRNSFYVFSHPLTEFVSPQRFVFIISPGNAEVVKYSDVRIKIKVQGEGPGDISFVYRNEGAGWNKEKLSSQRSPSELKGQEAALTQPDYSYQFKEVKRSFEYYAEAKGVQSDHYKITVVDKPRVVGLKLTFEFPRYTQLTTQVIDENDGNIRAIAGTKVGIEVKANKELERGDLVFSDSTRQGTKIEGNLALGEIVVEKDDSYSIDLWDKSGNQSQDPIEYTIAKVNDEFPSIEILEPGQDQDLTETMQVGLLVHISDDYGFSSLKLVYQIVSGGKESEEKSLDVEIPNKTRTEADIQYRWNLSSFPLLPGDLVRYRAVVYDNDSFSGPKKAESKTYTLRLPSLDEIITEVEKEQEGQVVDLETALKGQKELKKKLEDLSGEMNRYTGLDMDWQKKQQLEETLGKQQKLAGDLQKLAQKMDENIQKIEDNKLAAAELVEKMMEIKKLMDEIATPQMKEAMQKLAEALKNMDPDKLKEAMKKMEVSQDEMLKRLDRTLSLLKRMQAEQKLGNLIKMIEQMTQKQENLNQSIDNAPKEDLPGLSPDEKKVKDDFGEFEKKLKEFTDLATGLSMLPPQKIEDLANMPEESGVKEDMDQAISQLSGSDKSGSAKSGKSCSKKLKDMGEKLKNTQELMQSGQKEEIVQAIRKSLHDVFSLSDNQEELLDRVGMVDRGDMVLLDMAHDQQNLKTAGGRISEDLESLSHLTLFINEDVERYMALSVAGMDQAVQRLSERKKEVASDEQKEAIYDLNVTARQLLSAMQNANKSCSGSGMERMFQKMQGMCNKQGGINQETEKLGQCSGGSMLSLSQQEGLGRLAAEQEAVRKALSELESEFGNRSEIAGRLDKVGDEMKKVVQDFERMQVDQGTMDRQQKILSRLLDAEKSLKEKDYSKQRRAEVGEDVSRPSPKGLPSDITQGEESAKDDLLRFMQEAYPKEYEQLIKDYFKALSEERPKE